MDGGWNDQKSHEAVRLRDALRRWSRTCPVVRLPRRRRDERGTCFRRWENLGTWLRGIARRRQLMDDRSCRRRACAVEKGKAEVARLAEQELSASSFAGVEGCDGVVTLYAPGQIGSSSERLLRDALAHGFAECRSSAVDPGRRSLAIRYRKTP